MPTAVSRSMAAAVFLELSGDNLVAHTVEQGQRCVFAVGAQQFGKGGGQGRLRDDVGLDAGGKAFRPSFVVALDGGQPLFLP